MQDLGGVHVQCLTLSNVTNSTFGNLKRGNLHGRGFVSLRQAYNNATTSQVDVALKTIQFNGLYQAVSIQLQVTRIVVAASCKKHT